MNDELYQLSAVMNEDIVNIINTYQLSSNSRKQEAVYKRYYLYNFMYVHRHMTLSMIGYYFNRDHSTIVHGIQEHEHWYGIKDDKYLKSIHPIPDMLRPKRDNHDIVDVDVIPLDDEEVRISITGNFSKKVIKNFEQRMTKQDLSTIFA